MRALLEVRTNSSGLRRKKLKTGLVSRLSDDIKETATLGLNHESRCTLARQVDAVFLVHVIDSKIGCKEDVRIILTMILTNTEHAYLLSETQSLNF